MFKSLGIKTNVAVLDCGYTGFCPFFKGNWPALNLSDLKELCGL